MQKFENERIVIEKDFEGITVFRILDNEKYQSSVSLFDVNQVRPGTEILVVDKFRLADCFQQAYEVGKRDGKRNGKRDFSDMLNEMLKFSNTEKKKNAN